MFALTVKFRRSTASSLAQPKMVKSVVKDSSFPWKKLFM